MSNKDVFEIAGYTVEAVEIAFILTRHNHTRFSLSDFEGTEFLKDYTVFNASEKWGAMIKKNVAKYKMKLSETSS